MSVRRQGRSLALLTGLRIWRCRKLWRRSKMWLRPSVAVAVGVARAGWNPSPGTSMCRKYSHREKQKLFCIFSINEGRRRNEVYVFFIIVDFFFYCFLGPHLPHMEIPRLEVESEPQRPAYTTATAIRVLSCVYNLHHSSRQCQSLTHWARPGIEPATSWFLVRFISDLPWRELLKLIFSPWVIYTVPSVSAVQQSQHPHTLSFSFYLSSCSITSAWA